MATGRHVPKTSRRALYLTAGAIFCALIVALGGAAYAAARYDRANADRILPGVTIGGVDVGGVARPEGSAAGGGGAEEGLCGPLTISVGAQHWTVTPDTLGRRAQVTAAVQQALAAGQSLGTFDRAWHRLRGQSVHLAVPLTYGTQGDAIEHLVRSIARKVAVQPQDASIQLAADQRDVVFVHAKDGKKLNVGDAEDSIATALEDVERAVDLETRSVAPKV